MNEAKLNDVKEFWDKRPCNIRHSAKPVGSKAYFDEVEKRKYFVEPHIPSFAKFNEWKDKNVLEVGCGIGTDAINFARAGANYFGVDLSEESVKITKSRFAVFELAGSLKCVNAEELASHFEENTFDLVYSFGVIHHTPNPQKVIQEIHKLIKPGGILRLMLYAKNSWKNIMIEAGFDQPEAQYGCPIANTYTEADVVSLLSGFAITSIQQEHIFPYKIEKYVNYIFEKEPWFESMPDELFRALEKQLGWHLLIEATPCK
ncbi:MAG: methyltransferase type 12 [Gammaproteobacteria bacterium]|nr:MAG: methyltransferase type 12 [Gammaproteobacteria bacterium]